MNKGIEDFSVSREKGIGRWSWAQYFISLAHLVSTRSSDQSSKIGCVIINNFDYTILSTGYNSPPRGMNDRAVPQTRPEKYEWFVHAEEAAIANAARHGIRLKNSICFVTSLPCPRCMRKLINAGIVKIYYGNYQTQTDPELCEISKDMARQARIKFKQIPIELETEMVPQLLNNLSGKIRNVD